MRSRQRILELVERYYPGRPIEPKVGYFIEDLLARRGRDETSDR